MEHEFRRVAVHLCPPLPLTLLVINVMISPLFRLSPVLVFTDVDPYCFASFFGCIQ